MCFSSNDLKFLYVDLLHMSRPWEKLQEGIYLFSFEQSMRKIYMFKPWIYKFLFDEHGGI